MTRDEYVAYCFEAWRVAVLTCKRLAREWMDAAEFGMFHETIANMREAEANAIGWASR